MAEIRNRISSIERFRGKKISPFFFVGIQVFWIACFLLFWIYILSTSNGILASGDPKTALSDQMHIWGIAASFGLMLNSLVMPPVYAFCRFFSSSLKKIDIKVGSLWIISVSLVLIYSKEILWILD